MSNPGKPITVRGVTYPTRKACAEALGVTRAAVSQAEKFGTLAKLGKGRGSPVVVRGQRFKTVQQCAAHYRVHRQTVHNYRTARNLDALPDRRAEYAR